MFQLDTVRCARSCFHHGGRFLLQPLLPSPSLIVSLLPHPQQARRRRTRRLYLGVPLPCAA
ncbi:hypothetical protein C2845_PM15G17950 [Panicum miliaceum]|uniref:Uncharacterized protein n=1 Tax=Panicum miliaceum TaxID=4540 RepID=A0A3L6Q8A2_PANMI|nr:hypothetical protein C2845_PM15G17950 [Panicum miliaceum]